MARVQPGDGGTDWACARVQRPIVASNNPMQNRVRRFFMTSSSRSLSRDLLDVRQLPRFVEQRLLRPVEAEQNFELPIGAGRNPVRLLANRSLWPEINIHRTIDVLLQPGIL